MVGRRKGEFMDRFGTLNTFVVAAEALNFTEAGRLLGVSSSAVSKTIGRLEERLGVRLFHRSTRSISLTPEGEMFLARCKSIFGEFEAAEHELAQSVASPRGRLRVSLPLVPSLLGDTLTDFMAAYPDIELDLDFSDRLVDVIEEGFDAVIRTGDTADSRLMTKTLGSFRHRIVGSPAYLTARGKPGRPEDLAQHACLHHRFPATGKLERWPLSRAGKDLDPELPSAAVASTLEPLIKMAEKDVGLACVPIFMVRKQLADGRLISVLDDYLSSTRQFRILWPSSRQLSPKVKVFVAFMAEHLFPPEERG